MKDKIEKQDILLVDDNPENLRLLANILKPKGYTIRLANNGVKALDSVRAKAPKLILLDVQMPEMDGYETCKALKKNKAWKHIPIIFISALSEVMDKIKAFKSGAVDYIEKPFHVDEVLARVKTHLTVTVQREQLQEAVEKVQDAQNKMMQSEKMASLGTLSAGIAHEINNPINYVSAGAAGLELDFKDLLKLLNLYETIDFKAANPTIANQVALLKEEIDYKYVKANILETIKDIKMGASRTEEIVKGLKRFSRMDSEEKFEVNINEEIENNIKIVKRLSKKRVLFLVELEDNPNKIYGFTGQLNQLFMNLIMNAEQAIPDEGVIKIATFNKSTGVTIIISDNGVGIPKKLGDRIFDPFLTTKEVGEGTGLGLSISYRIVESHNGTITYFSEENIGTSFHVFLPKN
jgi:signal transduction histidine kinase